MTRRTNRHNLVGPRVVEEEKKESVEEEKKDEVTRSNNLVGDDLPQIDTSQPRPAVSDDQLPPFLEDLSEEAKRQVIEDWGMPASTPEMLKKGLLYTE